MLDEARRRRERGQDVIVGAIQPQVPPDTGNRLRSSRSSPEGSRIGHRNRRGENHPAAPAVCIVDGLAYDNPPGLRNASRWQDVQDLVSSGIKVISSINIQYVAELSEQVEAITGKHVTQTVPISFLNSADEIEIVDAPAEEPVDLAQGEQLAAEERR